MSDWAKRNLELEAVIEQDPDNIEGYLVYGDWLQAQGDPRGQLIALQCAAYQVPPEDSWRFVGPAYLFVEKHEEELLGGLVGLRGAVGWRWGFIDEASLSGNEITTRDGRTLPPVKLLLRFLTLPSARFLRNLHLGPTNKTLLSFQRIFDELNRTVLPTVERLSLDARPLFSGLSNHRRWSLGNLRLSGEFLPRVRSLTLCGRMGRLDQLDLPELRELTILSGMKLGALAHCLADVRLPKLERLVIQVPRVLMDSTRDSTLEGEELQGLLELQGLPRLKHLGLKRLIDSTSASGGVMCRLLARSALLRRLESLDLSDDSMTDEVARVLVDHAAAFAHLRQLDFSGYDLSDEMKARVGALCGNGDVSRGA